METISRREFGKNLLSSLLTFALLKTASERDLFAQGIRPTIDVWLKGIHELCRDLRKERISQPEWQQTIGKLHSRLDMSEILRFLDFDKLEKQMNSPEAGVQTKVFAFPKIDWLPGADERGWGMSIFAVDPDSAVTPHGHYNMVSAHLVLKGKFRVRHFDRVEELPEHWIIKPTIDRISAAGDETSISEKKDNVHWLQNVCGERAFTLDVVVAGLDPSLDYSFKQTFLDPAGGEKLKDDLIRARKISYGEAVTLYRKA